MKKFIDDLISYLDGKFTADLSISKKPKGHYAYEYGLIPSTEPYYTIQSLTNTDDSEDFNNLVSQTIDLQINLYGVKARISNVVTEALPFSMVIADLCEKFMQEFKYSTNKIVSMIMVTRSPTLPYNDGSKSYTTAIRYRIEIKLPYQTAN